MEKIKLSNGVEMPLLGYGVFLVPPAECERMRQNLDIFDFTLSDADMAQIATLNQHDTGTVSFGDPNFVKYLIENYG